MRLCTVRTKDIDSFFGLVLKKKILRISAAAHAFKLRPAQRATLADMHSYLDGWPNSEKLLRRLLQQIAEEPDRLAGTDDHSLPYLFDLDAIEYLPPVPRPSKILCIGLNYADHCEEQGKPLPEFPIVFNKFPSALNSHEAEIPLPVKVDRCIDYEAELAFVVGKRATRAKKRTAMNHVAGFMCFNDVSARSLQAREKQWSRAKGFDGAGPCGPHLVTPDEIGDPHNLSIKTRLNGKVMQSSNTRHLVFKTEALIQHISEMITLEPGDIVATGTCGGVGVYREPQVFMKPGDEVEVEIEKIGVLRNRCVKR